VVAPAEPSRRERRKQELRSRILAAASALFDEHGYAATRVQEICERADVAHKTFFNHFPSKRHLLRELAGQALRELLLDIESLRKHPASTAERLERFFGQVAARAEEAGPMHRELLTELIHVAHEAHLEPEQSRLLHEAFGALVRDGRSAGDISPRHSARTQTEMILGAFYALMFNWAHLDGYPLRQQALAAARFLAEALAPGKEAATP